LKRRSILCCVLLSWLALSPRGNGQIQTGPIKYETVHFARTYPGCGSHGRETCILVQADYPAVVGAPTAAAQSLINASIQTHLFAHADGSPGPTSGDGLAVELQDDYRDMQRRVPEYRTPWFDHRSATVLMNSRAVFSVQMRLDQFAGGAHPNSLRVYTNVRPGGENLSLNDVVKEGGVDQLTDVAERHFRQTRKLAEDADLKLAGFSFNDGQFALPDNFGFAVDGLIFYYNSYEIAPYYFGPTEVKIPYEEVRELLRPEFLPAQ
jgi:hypothetical protein